MQKWFFRLLVYLIWVSGCLEFAVAQGEDYQFARYSAEKGLSHNQVNCFLKDQQGFVWVGTAEGLNRFDGYSFKIFKHDVRDSTTLSDHYVNELFEDKQGYIWINTRLGYNIYDPATETIDHDINKAARRLGLPDANFNRIIKTRSGDYWISHNRLGLLKYITSKKLLLHLKFEPERGGRELPVVSDFNEDAQGNLWVVYDNGLVVRFNTVTFKTDFQSDLLQKKQLGRSANHRVFVDRDGEPWVYVIKAVRGVYYFDTKKNELIAGNASSSQFKLNNNIVSSIISGPDSGIWIGTDHGGINIVNKQDRTVSTLLYNPNDPKTISQNSIMTLYKDPSGMIWAGTFKKGFCNYHKNIFKFSLIRHLPTIPQSLPFDDVSVFAEDKKGNVWIGSNGGGLIYFDRKSNRFKQYKNIPGDPSSLSNNVIVSLFLDKNNILWVGTYFGGLNSFDGNKFKRYMHNPADSTSLIDDRVWEIFEDSKGRLWVGTLGDGLELFDRQKQVFKHYRPFAPNSIQSYYIASVIEDQSGNIWIGTANGIDVLKPGADKFIHYTHEANRPGTLSSTAVVSLAQDSFGNIWVGTSDGLNVYDKRRNGFVSYDSRDGLPDNSVLTILVDNKQNLWLGTPKGLVNFNITKRKDAIPEKFDITTYNEVDGLQGRSFNENSALRLNSGEMIFGGANGFTIFNPEKITSEPVNADVVLTDFQIFNKSIRPGEKQNKRVILEKSISVTKEIQLQYNQNVFTIEFAALNFLHSDKNHYLYTLEGFNDQWFEADNNTRKVTYTNLDPGKYSFKVKIKDGGTVSKERILKIHINPPFWKTPFAYILYFLATVGALALARWILLERERLNFKLEQERREALQLHELDMMKIKFFTNVSHEFRTPLTLMLTPLEGLLNNLQADSGVRNQLSMIHRNARRLLNLVTQLLDFKKLEVEETEFRPEKGDIIQFIREITHTFSDLSERKHIAFTFETDVESRYSLFDQEKLSRIMYNLLSNAFKFTSENGSVAVHVRIINQDGTEQLDVRVADTGVGIPADAQAKVFDRFFQHTLPDHLVNQGSGIGLAITREFVKLHGGNISVESQEGQGSTFIMFLPLHSVQGSETAQEVVQKVFVGETITASELSVAENRKDKPVLLLVEDNDEFREYLREVFQKDYQIHEAPNGKIGLEITLHTIPDLIVSDVMMPEMDGMQLCRMVKTDSRISHIPVILLTARAEDEQQLQGYETGADAYVTKPFRLDILQAQIRNLITLRERFQKQFQKHIRVEPSEIVVRSLDEQFINKAVKVVEDNMANSEFTVEELSSEMAMSRMYLYKKLLSLTGKTPVEFIRIIRIRRAASLLEKSQLTVSEIAYQVGFNNPKYFAKLFKEEYKILPTEFRKKETVGE
ncbi:hybrid sensor histidine kinase/response regulator transcription factor [Dyadobacter psychrotolerans]|uniref:histidine kinase n=1 Tax=Dyadobacter psychrotolerans TaxID=2541721 RepID=A0A4R5DK71_9BACT|nr:hybrid sensor histidine kinase/response regulator transcription factor [Dyadobacter psychrotolerans]TDE14552.1 hybrid sensor histidine kinase/response regulator [Dyadobacter psychrotolerans]